MQPIRLETADGDHVHDAVIPPFLPTRHQPTGAPDVVTWGVRVFKLHAWVDGEPIVYRECFAVAVVP
jgi:hypothetical protein